MTTLRIYSAYLLPHGYRQVSKLPHPQAQHLLQLWSTPVFWVPSSGRGLASCGVGVSWMECLASWQGCTVPRFGVKGRREAQDAVQSSGLLPFPTSAWAEESPPCLPLYRALQGAMRTWRSTVKFQHQCEGEECRVMVRASAPSPACQEVSLALLLRDGWPRAEDLISLGLTFFTNWTIREA